MRRALSLAALGEGFTGSNPMVGAVIVGPDGNIIGEGWHRRYGQGHAEVNAVASVADKSALTDSTIYVTLEPCSHYGKTPPCAKLLIDSGIPRVVVGATDPFPKVAGRGIDMLRKAGVEVATGVLANESRRLNHRFFTAHTQGRPFITLKWARSADGWLDRTRPEGTPGAAISNAVTQRLCHRLRSTHDAILVGAATVIADNPSLTNRLWPGLQPKPIVLDPHLLLPDREGWTIIREKIAIEELVKRLYSKGITSLLVEGGGSVLRSFIEAGAWDAAQEEISPVRFHSEGRVEAPRLDVPPAKSEKIGQNTLLHYCNPANELLV